MQGGKRKPAGLEFREAEVFRALQPAGFASKMRVAEACGRAESKKATGLCENAFSLSMVRDS